MLLLSSDDRSRRHEPSRDDRGGNRPRGDFGGHRGGERRVDARPRGDYRGSHRESDPREREYGSSGRYRERDRRHDNRHEQRSSRYEKRHRDVPHLEPEDR